MHIKRKHSQKRGEINSNCMFESFILFIHSLLRMYLLGCEYIS